MTSLASLNYALLTCNDALSTSCCGAGPTGYYWDAVPCGLDYPYRTICTEIDQCAYNNRKYLGYLSKCDGTTNKICECQMLFIRNANYIVDAPDSALQVSLTAGTGYIEITNTNFNYVSSGGSRTALLASYNINSLLSLVDGYPEWVASNGSTPLDGNMPSNILATGFYAIPASTTVDIPAFSPRFQIALGSEVGGFVNFTPDAENALASALQSEIENFTDMLGEVSCASNSNYDNAAETMAIECVWDGPNQCGVAQNYLRVVDSRIPYSASYSIDNVSTKAASGYSHGWMNFDEHYSRSGSGTYNAPDWFGPSNHCPYECDQYYNTTDSNTGPFPYDETQCCPQRGCMIGPNQNLTSGGYNVAGLWDNLENTIRINESCYSVSPYWFLFGKTGRFTREQTTTRTAHLAADCDYTDDCDRVPFNCSVDAFIPQFNQDVPWGVFGSYVPNIETQYHPTHGDDTTYIGFFYPERKGWDYKPKGWVLTRGEWTKTTEIDIYAVVHRAVPFYQGAEEFDDINLLAQLDTSTTTDFSSVSAGNGCGPVGLVYTTAGKTVGDFLDAINGVRLAPTDVQPTGCFVFSFCAASDEVRSLPAEWIMNTSPELYDLANVQAGYDASLGSARPDLDTTAHDGQNRLFSGADIRVGPLTYNLMWPRRSGNTVSAAKVYNYNPDVLYSNKAKLPPFCRHKLGPRNDITNQTWRGQEGTLNATLETPWWQIMAGRVETIVNISPHADVPAYISQLNVAVTGDAVIWNAFSGITQVDTGSHSLLQGTGYTQYNLATGLNAIYINDGSSTYRAFAATVPYANTVLVDDESYWDASNVPCVATAPGATLTPTNWSYREPPINTPYSNIITSSPYEIKSFLRRDCDATGVFTQFPCVPPSSTVYDNSSFLDCHSDNVHDANFIYTYGCGGYVCQTQWYLKAERCGCATQFYCETRGQAAHKYNREGNDDANQVLNGVDRGYSVTQPTLYICSENFHHQCDIPFLIKVPFQVVGTKTAMDTATGYDIYGTDFFAATPGEILQVYYCEDNERRYSYTDGQIERTFTPITSCSDNATPVVYHGIPMVPFNTECRGWCQYIDPVLAVRVKREDIPQTWPPTAYRMDRAYGVFCSVNPYSASIDEICSASATSAQLELGWDTLEGLVPHCRPEHIDPATGYPYAFGESFLFAYNGLHCYTRAAANEITEGDLCNTGEPNRIDINCATKCCECDFKCNPANGENTLGPYTCPCTFTLTAHMTNTKTGILYQCDYTQFPGGSSHAACVVGCCQNGDYRIAGKYGGTYSYTETATLTYDGDECCECLESQVSGDWRTVYDTSGINCTGPCGPEGTFVFQCTSTEPICVSGPYICEDVISDPASCHNLYNFIPAWTVGTTTGYVFTRDGFGGCSDDICAQAIDANWSRTMAVTYGYCNEVDYAWTGSTTINYAGVSPHDGANLGITIDGSTYETGGGAETYEGDYTRSASTCTPCLAGFLLGAKTLPYITGWLDNAEIGCGDANILYRVGTATGVYHPICY